MTASALSLIVEVPLNLLRKVILFTWIHLAASSVSRSSTIPPFASFLAPMNVKLARSWSLSRLLMA
jgi:hypothetical protein